MGYCNNFNSDKIEKFARLFSTMYKWNTVAEKRRTIKRPDLIKMFKNQKELNFNFNNIEIVVLTLA